VLPVSRGMTKRRARSMEMKVSRLIGGPPDR
jgi:hypothetical protein